MDSLNTGHAIISEIVRDGEQVCIARDYLGVEPSTCAVCGAMRFCEKDRSDDDIAKLLDRIWRDGFRRNFFWSMEEDGYYD